MILSASFPYSSSAASLTFDAVPLQLPVVSPLLSKLVCIGTLITALPSGNDERVVAVRLVESLQLTLIRRVTAKRCLAIGKIFPEPAVNDVHESRFRVLLVTRCLVSHQMLVTVTVHQHVTLVVEQGKVVHLVCPTLAALPDVMDMHILVWRYPAPAVLANAMLTVRQVRLDVDKSMQVALPVLFSAD